MSGVDLLEILHMIIKEAIFSTVFLQIWVGSYVFVPLGARCSSVVRAFAHGAMGRRIDPSGGEPIELYLVPASAPQLV